MKGADIVTRLRSNLPKFTDRFTEEVGIDSITPAGTTATVTTDAAHGLSVGNAVIILGANASISISSITRSGTVATATTSQDHDLTEVYHETVVLSGATEAEFNRDRFADSGRTRAAVRL